MMLITRNWTLIKIGNTRFELQNREEKVLASGSEGAVLAAALLLTEDKNFVNSCREHIEEDKKNENLL